MKNSKYVVLVCNMADLEKDNGKKTLTYTTVRSVITKNVPPADLFSWLPKSCFPIFRIEYSNTSKKEKMLFPNL